ncbi:uncharacterized protein N7443_000346 [Penicillium atrosanguineum]|uniref:uncharacterized protein n=1 Tax=Penicillium atrosanguineum TaxID=1132637 RepID=UPI0023855079|nr:uncharacterized protein N7443_000346 [Penicillium atrosanguineum]KAJ5313462.1 hypothetical protein N7443_000346 [Penicillium atrosanguineum]
MKQGRSQRTRKESTILAQHESQLDLSIQSSTSSINIEPSQEKTALNRQHSLPEGGKFDSGQGQVQELLPKFSTDVSPRFDPNFLERLSQQLSVQDGDILSGLIISQLPSFTSENLPSPSPSSGDEVELSPQDVSGFDINITDNFPYLHTSNLLLPPTPPTQSCQCLAAVVFAVEEFKTSCNTRNRAELDTTIAYQKKAINCCRWMINCITCKNKRENFVLLVFIMEIIVAASGQIVVLYSMKDGTSDTQPTIGLSSLQDYDHIPEVWDFGAASSSPSVSTKSASMNMLSDWRELLLGDYEVSSRQEWEHLVRVLILLQLRAMIEMFAAMKNMSDDVLGEMQKAILGRAETSVCEFEKSVCIQ